MTFYFSTYDFLKEKNYHPMIAGAGAGITNWSITYPTDVIRNRQIAQNISFIEAYKKGNFFRLFTLCNKSITC